MPLARKHQHAKDCATMARIISRIYDNPATLVDAERHRLKQIETEKHRKARRKAALVRKATQQKRQKKAQPTGRPNYRAGMGQEFYKTREWYEVRYRVLREQGAKCNCCGSSRKEGLIMHVDHILPRSKFPALELERSNLQVLCEPCNIGKSNKDSTNWRIQKAAPLPSA